MFWIFRIRRNFVGKTAIPTKFRRNWSSVWIRRKENIRRKSVNISDDFPTDYDGQISDGIPTKYFVGKTLSVICRKMFRPTKIVGIVDVRENRRELSVGNFRRLCPSEISDAFVSSVNSDALFPSVISEELSVRNVVARVFRRIWSSETSDKYLTKFFDFII